MRIINGDCRLRLDNLLLESDQVHAVITDPPYHLLSIVKRFGAKNAAPAKHGRDGRFTRSSANFIGETWDGEDKGYQVAHDVEVWRRCFDLLLPGGFLLAFSSPKTGHRMACAIEDAGFIMHPLIGWINGQGAPKGHSVADAGPEWEGWYHGTQTLKPALEPIYMAQKPFSERTGVANVLAHGTGALNIDGSRVNPRAGEVHRNWPANVLHDEGIAASVVLGETRMKYFNAIYHHKATKDDRIDRLHPTVKPIALLEWLIGLVSTPGQIILDPFAGTGTTGVAAMRTGRKSILIEREEKYCRIIRNRVGLERYKDIL